MKLREFVRLLGKRMPSKFVGWHGQRTSDKRRQSRKNQVRQFYPTAALASRISLRAALPLLVARVLPVPSY